MTELAWTATRADTIDRFQGQTPRPEDEAAIIDVFETHPQLVLRAIDETASALGAGKITWAWAVLASRLTRGTAALREATVDTSGERTRHIRNAKTWIANAGIYYDHEDHVRAELFGDEISRGRLDAYKHDEKLQAELVDYWRKQRPRGVKAEQDAEAWMAKCKTDRETILEQKRKALAELRAELDAQQTPVPAVPVGDNDIDW